MYRSVSEKTKVLIIIKNTDGGTGTYVKQMLNIQKESDNKLDFIILIFGKQKYKLFNNKKLNIYYINTKIYPEYYKFNLLIFASLMKEVFFTFLLIHKIKPTTIISVDTHCNLVASIVSKFSIKKIKLILTVHNNLEKVTNNKLSSTLQFILKWMGSFFFKKANYIVSPSIGLSEQFKAFFCIKKEVLTIPSGINIEQVKKLADRKCKLPIGIKKTDIIITSVGRFEKQKDFYTLIKSFSIVHAKNSNSILLLIGDGYERNDLFDLTKKLNISEKVFFLGWKNNIYPYLKISHVFVLSSLYEGFGYVILEAMSQGLPIITTDALYGPSEILDRGKYGIITPIGDVEKLSLSIQSLLLNYKERNRLAQLSKQRLQSYTEKKMYDSYLALLES